LAARAASAEPFVFQNVVGSGNVQSGPSQGAGGTTAQQVQTVDLGDVTGTVCDCGEIEPTGAGAGATGVPGSKGGFPKFPLYAAAVAPIPCLFGLCSNPPGTPEPTPPPPGTVPEPVTITTLAAGLAALAGLRTRRRRA